MTRQDKTNDTKQKGYWWIITAYNQDIEYLENIMSHKTEFPEWLREIWGGKEACPSTERLHFQCALRTAEVRMSKITKVLTQSHIEKMRSSKEQLKDYVMKAETAVGPKSTSTNPKFYTMESLMVKLGETFVERLDEDHSIITDNDDYGFGVISDELLKHNFFLISLCSQPQIARAWKLYYNRCIKRYKELRDEVPAT